MTSPDESTLRSLYPGTAGQIYLDSAAIGLVSQRVVDAVRTVLEDHCRLGIAANNGWRSEISRTRKLAAQLVGGQLIELPTVKTPAQLLPW